MTACEILVASVATLGIGMLFVTVATAIVIWRVTRRDYLGKVKR